MKTIVAIDDERAILECYQQTLAAAGYEVHVTSEAETGLRWIREKQPDLVLLDIRMPQKDGFDVYAELRRARKIPVLFITAYPKSFTSDSERVASLWENEFADGDTDILYKPFSLDALYAKVAGLIGGADEAPER
ncbi:MAG: response regulator [Lentisphaerae bacterium]|nr:response regulator [Lentisphaerota bacterium]